MPEGDAPAGPLPDQSLPVGSRTDCELRRSRRMAGLPELGRPRPQRDRRTGRGRDRHPPGRRLVPRPVSLGPGGTGWAALPTPETLSCRSHRAATTSSPGPRSSSPWRIAPCESDIRIVPTSGTSGPRLIVAAGYAGVSVLARQQPRRRTRTAPSTSRRSAGRRVYGHLVHLPEDRRRDADHVCGRQRRGARRDRPRQAGTATGHCDISTVFAGTGPGRACSRAETGRVR